MLNKYKLIFSLTIVGCIMIFAVISLVRFLDGMTTEESIEDTICDIRNSHDMAKITLCESNREFTLLVELKDSFGNSNFDRINTFVNKTKTRLFKNANEHFVYLINPSDTLTIYFTSDNDGDLIHGVIVQ
jgi:hypothetical protein